jgi:hypothetical protein
MADTLADYAGQNRRVGQIPAKTVHIPSGTGKIRRGAGH